MTNYKFVNEVNGHPIPTGSQSIEISNGENIITYTFIGSKGIEGSVSVHRDVKGNLDKVKRAIKDVRDKGIFNQMLVKVFNANTKTHYLPGPNHVSNKFLGI